MGSRSSPSLSSRYRRATGQQELSIAWDGYRKIIDTSIRRKGPQIAPLRSHLWPPARLLTLVHDWTWVDKIRHPDDRACASAA